MPIEAELRRRLTDGTLVDWTLRDATVEDGIPTDPVSDAVARSRLLDIKTSVDGLEQLLSDVLGAVDDATADTMLSLLREVRDKTAALNDDLGTDGANPPAIAGTGVRGWLRAIYDRLTAGIGRTWTLGSDTDTVTAVGPLTDTQLRATPVAVADPTVDELVLELNDVEEVLGSLLDSDTAGTILGRLKRLVTITQTLATEATLGALLLEVDDLEETLAGVRAEQLRRTDGLPAGTNVLGKVGLDPDASNYVTPSMAKAVAEGKGFYCGVRVPDVAPGSTVTFSLANPSTSGKVFKIVETRLWNTATDALRIEIYENSVIAAGATALTPWNPNRANPIASVAEFRYGVGIRSGGTKRDVEAQCVRDESFDPDDVLVIMPPNTSLQLTVVVPGTLLNNQSITGAVRWIEDPL